MRIRADNGFVLELDGYEPWEDMDWLGVHLGVLVPTERDTPFVEVCLLPEDVIELWAVAESHQEEANLWPDHTDFKDVDLKTNAGEDRPRELHLTFSYKAETSEASVVELVFHIQKRRLIATYLRSLIPAGYSPKPEFPAGTSHLPVGASEEEPDVPF